MRNRFSNNWSGRWLKQRKVDKKVTRLSGRLFFVVPNRDL